MGQSTRPAVPPRSPVSQSGQTAGQEEPLLSPLFQVLGHINSCHSRHVKEGKSKPMLGKFGKIFPKKRAYCDMPQYATIHTIH